MPVRRTQRTRGGASAGPAVLSEVLNGHLAGFSKTEWQALMTYLRRMVDNGRAMRQDE